jgi:very-short-patch-repair endonuclease
MSEDFRLGDAQEPETCVQNAADIAIARVKEFARAVRHVFFRWDLEYTPPPGRISAELEKCAVSIAQSAYDNERAIIVSGVLPYCESDIERLFAMRLYTSLFASIYSSKFFSCRQVPWRETYVNLEEWVRWLRIKTTDIGIVSVFMQAPIGDYRVDFLLAGLVETTGSIHWLVVECDGHDFHEKTKEQVARDRARDRFITEQGLPIMRFTGREIWADPEACVGQAVNYITTRMEPELDPNLFRWEDET